MELVRKSALDQAISTALTPWRKPRTVHDPGKILLDAALAVALGGDCPADAGMLRAERPCPVRSPRIPPFPVSSMPSPLPGRQHWPRKAVSTW